MSKFIRRQWTADLGGQTKKDRRWCEYEAYVPDPLVGRIFTFNGDVAAEVAEAEAAIARLDVEAIALTDSEALARILLRAEAVASSRIEGLEIDARRLLHAEVLRSLDTAPSDVTAAEVLSNIDAMIFGVEQVSENDKITLDIILEIHRRLLNNTRLAEYGGRFRDQQNWIGGSAYNPCSAAFVPPPKEYVGDLMDDLCAFCNEDGLPAVAQAAIAHAQFETIHPFVDGNGRTGRALIQLVLRRRGLARRVLPPVSLVLATWAKDYVTALQGVVYRGPVTSKEANAGANRWVNQFAIACSRAVEDVTGFEKRAQQVQEQWRSRLGPLRKNSATDLLLRALPGAPVVTVNSAAALITRAFSATNNAIAQLETAGILKQVNIGRRNRAYEAPEIITAFTALERQLGSPAGDTESSHRTAR